MSIHFLRIGMYRPFCKQESLLRFPGCIQMIYRIPSMFPTPDAPNQVIGVTGRGAKRGFLCSNDGCYP